MSTYVETEFNDDMKEHISIDTKVSVIVPCYNNDRWPQLVAAVESLLAQRPTPAEIVVVVDHNPLLLARAQAQLPGVTVLANRYAHGASGARNTGVEHTTTPLVAMLDDDARAQPDWLAQIVAPMTDPSVIGAGGPVVPIWESARPSWFPDELLWTVGATYNRALRPTATRNVWAVSMVLRRSAFDAVGGFRTDFTKVGTRSQPEDTDLCLRVSQTVGGAWLFVPAAVVEHHVPSERATLGYLIRRCFAEGRGKARLASRHRGLHLELEWAYLRRTLPIAICHGFTRTLTGGGSSGASQALCLIAALSAACLGGTIETARRWLSLSGPAQQSAKTQAETSHK